MLGKGLGYAPTLAIDKVGARLDMKLLTNKILNQSNINLSNKIHLQQTTDSYSLPSTTAALFPVQKMLLMRLFIERSLVSMKSSDAHRESSPPI